MELTSVYLFMQPEKDKQTEEIASIQFRLHFRSQSVDLEYADKTACDSLFDNFFKNLMKLQPIYYKVYWDEVLRRGSPISGKYRKSIADGV